MLETEGNGTLAFPNAGETLRIDRAVADRAGEIVRAHQLPVAGRNGPGRGNGPPGLSAFRTITEVAECGPNRDEIC